MVKGEGCIEGFGVKTRGKETALRTRRRLEDNIKMDLQEVAYGAWID
jgi:hypothetical protein